MLWFGVVWCDMTWHSLVWFEKMKNGEKKNQKSFGAVGCWLLVVSCEGRRNKLGT